MQSLITSNAYLYQREINLSFITISRMKYLFLKGFFFRVQSYSDNKINNNQLILLLFHVKFNQLSSE